MLNTQIADGIFAPPKPAASWRDLSHATQQAMWTGCQSVASPKSRSGRMAQREVTWGFSSPRLGVTPTSRYDRNSMYRLSGLQGVLPLAAAETRAVRVDEALHGTERMVASCLNVDRAVWPHGMCDVLRVLRKSAIKRGAAHFDDQGLRG
jgi:hypothetical protein